MKEDIPVPVFHDKGEYILLDDAEAGEFLDIMEGTRNSKEIKEFNDLFEFIEYPSDDTIVERGVPQNVMYIYVPYSFINGLCNHIKIKKAYIIERYENWDKINIEKYIKNLQVFNTDYSVLPDDEIFLGESENSYWYIWADKDVSDCCIGRCEKRISFEKFNELFLKEIFNNKMENTPTENSECITGEFMELPLPKGGWNI